MSPSCTASLAIIVPTRSPFCEISKSQKSGHVLLRKAYHSTRAAPLGRWLGLTPEQPALCLRGFPGWPRAAPSRVSGPPGLGRR
eukprot:scaffold34380_cov37-Phaeocystis_antarctica.AAC.1